MHAKQKQGQGMEVHVFEGPFAKSGEIPIGIPVVGSRCIGAG
jgi:hypothetical protein